MHRDNKLIEVDAEDILSGDILKVETGLIFPADCILIKKNDKFLCDESQITGESDLMEKNIADSCSDEQSPFLISGTKCMDGSGTALVCLTGVNSLLGKTRASLQTEPEPTPLQLKLEDLANTIGIIGSSGAILTFVGCTMGLVIGSFTSEDSPDLISMDTLNEMLSFVILAITIIVMAVPEGLPMAVTIALAFSVNTMKNHNNLVRELEACETMGGATDICSDKTGTLTKNDMTVIDIYVNKQMTDVSKGVPDNLKKDKTIQLICRDVAINSGATPDFDIENKNQTGNRTELALLRFAKNLGIDYNDLRPSEQILLAKPFSSTRKKMSTLYRDNQGKRFILVKGAPEIILKNCSKYLHKDQVLDIDQQY